METHRNAMVLVVDDNPDLADLYTDWLSDYHTVKTAYGGESALNQLDTSVDIVLLDRRMSDISGEDVLKTIRKRELNCQVALVTSIKMDYESLPLGFDDYLHKPVNKSDLQTLVESLLIRIEYSDKLQEYFALVSKRVALQTEKEAVEFADHPAVQQLDDQIADLNDEIDGLLADFSDEDYRAVFTALDKNNNTNTSFLCLG